MTRLLDAPLARLDPSPPTPLPEAERGEKRPSLVEPLSASERGWGEVAADWSALVKLRLSSMVLFTAAVGFILAAGGAVDWLLLVHALAGTGLLAAGASALNQVWERRTDARMERTRDRPLPAGRIRVGDAVAFGVAASLVGLAYLWIVVNPLTALLGLVTLLTYIFAYTPLKKWSAINTLVGAVPGAIPPLMGWTAAGGALGPAAASLFGILLVWQLPHFWAIAWLYRRDYAAAGLRMVPALDRQGGKLTGRLMVQHCLLLLAAGFAPYAVGLAGPVYAIGSGVLGVLFLGFGVRFLITPTETRARQMLWASLIYLPLVMTLLLIDRV